ncbi:adenylate/guanylate cyclase domain-containing protein [Magnetospirillum sulfuroxidans]|uniref:Response regulator n=1 Tax=Magnetospirillum sulfuroxidans TaxID=611300 RepID=A0ABS5I7J0_9PROT|nr:adenylate/guanylate cyclase domain-containing protein [Magnetospirillum sulfuroxidans]MBR9970389.1 response regulator [Magnetospirillum sulfuroxidans]
MTTDTTAALPSGAILIVDDSRTAQAVMEKAIRLFSTIEVITADTGTAGLEMLADKSISLILLDHHLPDMTGLDFMASFIRVPDYRDIPVLVVTAQEHDDSLVSAYLNAGAADFMPKRYRPPIFRARITGLLAQNANMRQRRAVEETLCAEHEKQRTLLRNTLPEKVVDEFMANGTFRPSVIDHAGVLFADVCGFTNFTRNNTPTKVVVNLNRLIRRFEAISETFGLEKIKTIGDAYMAACGVLEKVPNVEDRLIAAALEMIRQTRELEIGWEVRIGVAFGPTVAGIIGGKRMQFDVWGDTVNTAARLCSSAQPSGLCLPAKALAHLGDRFGSAEIRRLPLKGLGEYEVAFLSGLTVPSLTA